MPVLFKPLESESFGTPSLDKKTHDGRSRKHRVIGQIINHVELEVVALWVKE